MRRTLIHNATIVNEGQSTQGSVVIAPDGSIAEILTHGKPLSAPCNDIIDASGCYLLPGVIDEHVHFREPGLTQKADILSESRAAAAGGVTSVMDMPNTLPQTTTLEDLAAKQELMNQRCIVNHSCYFGATNTNTHLLSKLDRHHVCGVKLFMGSSTGNMLVDKERTLRRIFKNTDLLIAAHCEDQTIIQENIKRYYSTYKACADIPLSKHSAIRSTAACFQSSRLAIQLAKEAEARLHILHISTLKELKLLDDTPLSAEKKITAEVCVPHLLFCYTDYATLGTRIKCNPAIKRNPDREALRQAVNGNLLDTIATDHAPHLLSEKQGGSLKAASGIPMIQFSLVAMLELVSQGILSIETVVQKMCHNPAILYRIEKRGYIREGYKADLVLVRPHSPWTLTTEKIQNKCKWSPLEGRTFQWRIEKTLINGRMAYDGEQVDENCRGEELTFA